MDDEMRKRIMKSHTSVGAISMALAVLLIATGCSRKEPVQANEPAAPAAASDVATTAAAPAAEATTAAADANTGATIYAINCATCHGAKGEGDGVAAAALDPKPANFAAGAFKYDANGNGAPGDVDDIKAIVHDGAAKHGGSPMMAPWPMLTPEQLQAVAEYVKSLHGG
jgi:mono/diheme cytochrome c family protein